MNTLISIALFIFIAPFAIYGVVMALSLVVQIVAWAVYGIYEFIVFVLDIFIGKPYRGLKIAIHWIGSHTQ